MNPSCGKRVVIENKHALTCGDDSCIEFMAIIDAHHDGTCDTTCIAKCYGKIAMMYNKKTGNDVIKQFSVKWRDILQNEYEKIAMAVGREIENVEAKWKSARSIDGNPSKRKKIDVDTVVYDNTLFNNIEMDGDSSMWTDAQKLEFCKRRMITYLNMNEYSTEDAKDMFSSIFGFVSGAEQDFETRWANRHQYAVEPCDTTDD